MYFDLTDEQKSLRDMLTGFLGERFGAAEGIAATETRALDKGLWRDLSALGLGGILVPEDQGGLGMDLLTLGVVAEACGTYAVPAPVVPNALAAWIIAVGGSDQQRERWLAPLMAGEAVAAFALAERDGWMPDDWKASLSDATVSKTNVERASDADLLIVGLAGGSLAIVPTDKAVLTPLDSLDRSRPLDDAQFDGRAAELLPASRELVNRLADALLVLNAADALGAALGAQERAVGYAKERKQFDRLIGSFQALKHQLADLSVELEPSRPLYWYAAHGWDTDRPDARRLAAIAKAHICEIAVNATRAVIEAHGGIGYTWEYPAHLLLKRAMFDRAFMGMPALHRERAATLAGWRGKNERRNDALGKAGVSAGAERAAVGAH